MLPSLLITTSAWSATWREVPSLARLTEDSACVVRGVVRSAQSEEAPFGLVTTYEIDVEGTLAGVAPRVVTVTLPGGRADDGSAQTWSGVPLWAEGDEVLVFVRRDGRMPLAGVFTLRDHEVVDPLGRFGGWTPLDSDLSTLIAAH